MKPITALHDDIEYYLVLIDNNLWKATCNAEKTLSATAGHPLAALEFLKLKIADLEESVRKQLEGYKR